jgi:crossover junction endodeoxyribonuclease RusA
MSGDELQIRVIGTPAPQGSKRALGRGVLVESSPNVKPWRTAVAYAARQRMRHRRHPGFPSGPLAVTITFYVKRPQNISPYNPHQYPYRRPDLDKYIRATLDGLTESGVWRDDAQVITLYARKRFAPSGEPTGAYIAIETGPNGTPR